MIELQTLVSYINSLFLSEQPIVDLSNNGLQVQGKSKIKKMAFAVDTSLALIDNAIKGKADFIFVHHGISWGDSLKYLTNYNARLVKPLFVNDISLYAAHLPLDVHCEIGHNARLANITNLENKKGFGEHNFGVMGDLPLPSTTEDLAAYLNNELNRLIKQYSTCTIRSILQDRFGIIKRHDPIQRIGIISGGSGMSSLMSAITENLDCLITGELTHSMYHLAKENDIAVIAPGHYKTEVPGVIAVMEKIQNTFNVEAEFINIPSGL